MKIMNPFMCIYQKEAQVQTARKSGLQKLDGCLLANNNSHIPKKELKELLRVVSRHYFLICAEWKNYFRIDTIKFYC